METHLREMPPGTGLWILYAGCQAWIYRFWTWPGEYMATIDGQNCQLRQLRRADPTDYLRLMRDLGGQL